MNHFWIKFHKQVVGEQWFTAAVRLPRTIFSRVIIGARQFQPVFRGVPGHVEVARACSTVIPGLHNDSYPFNRGARIAKVYAKLIIFPGLRYTVRVHAN